MLMARVVRNVTQMFRQPSHMEIAMRLAKPLLVLAMTVNAVGCRDALTEAPEQSPDTGSALAAATAAELYYSVTPASVVIDGTVTSAAFSVKSTRTAALSDSLRLVPVDGWATASDWSRGTHTATLNVQQNDSWVRGRDVKVSIITTRGGRASNRGEVLLRQRVALDKPKFVQRSVTVQGTDTLIQLQVAGNPSINVFATSAQPWVTTVLSPATSMQPIAVKIGANNGGARTSRLVLRAIRVGATGVGEDVDTIVVTQAAEVLTPTPIPTPIPSPSTWFTVAPAPITAAPTGATYTISIATNTTGAYVIVAPNQSWMRIIGSLTATGNVSRQVQVDANYTGNARSGTFKVGTLDVTVTQQTAPVSPQAIDVNPKSDTARSAVDTLTFQVTAPAGKSWNAGTLTTAWLKYLGAKSGVGNGVVRLIASANTSGTRSAKVNIAGIVVSIQQNAALALAPATIAFTSAAGSGTTNIVVAAGENWAVSKPVSAAWLTITSATSGAGPSVLKVAAATNTGAARSANVTVNQATLVVTQSAGAQPPTVDAITIAPQIVQLSATPSQATIQVQTSTSNRYWSLGGFDATWLTIFGGNFGTGSQSRTLNAVYNGGEARGALVRAFSDDGAEAFVTVIQAGITTGFPKPVTGVALSTSKIVLASTSTRFTVTVTAPNATCWSASLTALWISGLAKQASYCGSTTLNFIPSFNGGKSRGAVLLIAGNWVTVVQRGTAD